MKIYFRPNEPICKCGNLLSEVYNGIGNTALGTFNSIYTCASIKHIAQTYNYIHCGLCNEIYNSSTNTWKSLTKEIKKHLKEEHRINTNDEHYVSVNKNNNTVLIRTGIGGIKLVLPNFISMFVQSNIREMFTRAYYDFLENRKQGEYDLMDARGYRKIDDGRYELMSFEDVEFTCTICGGEYDSAGKEIFEEHVEQCIRQFN